MHYGLSPLTNESAWNFYEALRRDKRVGFADEPANLSEHWKKIGVVKTASPKLWMDAYLAAFAVAGQHLLVTTDKGFKQFKNLDIVPIPKI